MYTYKYPMPAIAADLLMIHQNDILLIKRADFSDAFPGVLALPGGFMNIAETIEHSAVRELKEETGIELSDLDLRLLGVYSRVNRDPRQRTIGVAFHHIFPVKPITKAGDDAAECRWVHINDILSGEIQLAFDHNEIVRDFSLL